MDCLIRNIVEEPLSILITLVKKLQKSVDALELNVEAIKQTQLNIIEIQKQEQECQHKMLERIKTGSFGC
jgi:phage shock protein A